MLTKIAATLYAADVVFKVLLGRNTLMIFGSQVDMFWVIALGLAIATGIYTALGGLRVIMYTAVLKRRSCFSGRFAYSISACTSLVTDIYWPDGMR